MVGGSAAGGGGCEGGGACGVRGDAAPVGEEMPLPALVLVRAELVGDATDTLFVSELPPLSAVLTDDRRTRRGDALDMSEEKDPPDLRFSPLPRFSLGSEGEPEPGRPPYFFTHSSHTAKED